MTNFTTSRSPSGYPAYAPNSRPAYRGGAVAGGATAFDWTQFFGPSDNGYVFDGSQSRFYTDSAMTTLATASGTDPVGGIEDLSGKGNNLTQATSANKPVFYNDGAISCIRVGSVSGVNREITSAWNTNTGRSTIYYVAKQTVPTNVAYYCSSADLAQRLYFAKAIDGIRYVAGSTFASPVSLATPAVHCGRIIVPGASPALSTHYAKAGISYTGGTTISDYNGSTNPMRTVGDPGGGGGTDGYIDIPFMMQIDRVLSDGERAAIEAQIESAFARWAP